MEYRTKAVIIPKEIVEKLNIEEGEKLLVQVIDDQTIELKLIRYKMSDEVMIIR